MGPPLPIGRIAAFGDLLAHRIGPRASGDETDSGVLAGLARGILLAALSRYRYDQLLTPLAVIRSTRPEQRRSENSARPRAGALADRKKPSVSTERKGRL